MKGMKGRKEGREKVKLCTRYLSLIHHPFRVKQKSCSFERDHIHITCITVYCYIVILLVVIVVNVLLCVIYKFNFIIGMYVHEKQATGVCYYLW